MNGVDRQAFPFNVAVPDILGLAPYQPGKPVEELERELGIKNAIKLASNENPFGPCEEAKQAMLRSQIDVGLYPDANGYYLKGVLSQTLEVSENNITLGNGSNDVLDLIARVFLQPGDEAVFSQYAFLVYPLVTRAVAAKAIVTEAANWGHDLQAMSRAITPRTKIIFIANPNNPTGTYVDEQQLIELLAGVPERVIVVLDEAYFEYVQRADYPDGISLIDRYPNLVVTRTFSKIYGLAGLRIGYAVASKDITDLLNRVRQPFNVNALAQNAAIAALENIEHVEKCRKLNQQELARFAEFCQELGIAYIPSVANFLTVEFGDKTPEIYRGLLHQGLITRPIENYQMPEHLRITIGTPEDMDRLVGVLRELL